MSKLKSLYNRLTGNQSSLDLPPIINMTFSSSLKDSFCGGTLAGKNVLFVNSEKASLSPFMERYEKEECFCNVVANTNELTIEDLLNAENEMIGYYDCIVNIINGNSVEDPVKQFYRWLQVESPFLSAYNHQATICTIIIAETVKQAEVLKPAYEHLINSVAYLINNHNIVVNAILTSPNVKMKDVAATASFLCSKYGEALTGETIKLG